MERNGERVVLIDFKELDHETVEIGKSKFCSIHWQAGDPARADAARVWRQSGGRISSSFEEVNLFSSYRLCPIEGNLFYPESIDLNVNFI